MKSTVSVDFLLPLGPLLSSMLEWDIHKTDVIPRKQEALECVCYGLTWLITRNAELMGLPWRFLNYEKNPISSY